WASQAPFARDFSERMYTSDKVDIPETVWNTAIPVGASRWQIRCSPRRHSTSCTSPPLIAPPSGEAVHLCLWRLPMRGSRALAALTAASLMATTSMSYAQSVDLSKWSPEYVKEIAGTETFDTAG